MRGRRTAPELGERLGRWLGLVGLTGLRGALSQTVLVGTWLSRKTLEQVQSTAGMFESI